MTPSIDDRAQRWLERTAPEKTCNWCKHPDKPVYRGGLCRRCYRIKTELRRLHGEVERRKALGALHPMFGLGNLQFDYIVAIDMAEAAQGEGTDYGSLRGEDVSPLDLEKEFRFISRMFLRKDLYRGFAGLFDDVFTPSQRRVLMYVLSGMSREYLRRNRRRFAWDDPDGRTPEEALRERSSGTYRVEQDPVSIRGSLQKREE